MGAKAQKPPNISWLYARSYDEDENIESLIVDSKGNSLFNYSGFFTSSSFFESYDINGNGISIFTKLDSDGQELFTKTLQLPLSENNIVQSYDPGALIRINDSLSIYYCRIFLTKPIDSYTSGTYMFLLNENLDILHKKKYNELNPDHFNLISSVKNRMKLISNEKNKTFKLCLSAKDSTGNYKYCINEYDYSLNLLSQFKYGGEEDNHIKSIAWIDYNTVIIAGESNKPGSDFIHFDSLAYENSNSEDFINILKIKNNQITKGYYLFLNQPFNFFNLDLTITESGNIALIHDWYYDITNLKNTSFFTNGYGMLIKTLDLDFNLLDEKGVSAKNINSSLLLLNIHSVDDKVIITGSTTDKQFIFNNQTYKFNTTQFRLWYTYILILDESLEYFESFDFKASHVLVPSGSVIYNSNNLIIHGLFENNSNSPPFDTEVFCCDQFFEPFVVNIDLSDPNLTAPTYSCSGNVSVRNNLTSDKFYIDLQFNNSYQTEFKLYNSIGQVVDKFNHQNIIEKETIEHSVGTLPDGVYILSVNNSIQKCTERIVVQNSK